jgi:drug/metabolite transporter (DMT)-like permease
LRITGTRIIWAVLAFVWGSTWLFIKVGLEDLPPFTFVGLRFVIALVPLVLFMGLSGVKLPRAGADWRLLGLTGFLTFAAGYGLVFWGEQYLSSGLTAVLFTTYPLFGLFIAHFLLPAEPLTARRVAGALLGIAGVAVIFADQFAGQGATALWGALAVLTSSAGGALSGVLIKKRGGHLDPVVVTTVQMALGGLPLLAVGLLTERSVLEIAWTPKALFSLFYLALVGTSLAFVLWYRLMRATQVTRAQIMPVLNTLVAVLLGTWVLHERYGIRGLIGAAAVLCGVTLSLWRPSAEGGKDRAGELES